MLHFASHDKKYKTQFILLQCSCLFVVAKHQALPNFILKEPLNLLYYLHSDMYTIPLKSPIPCAELPGAGVEPQHSLSGPHCPPPANGA